MLGRAIWDKLPECIFKNSKLPEWSEDKFKIFKNQEGDLSQKLLESTKWLLVNYTKPTKQFLLKLVSYNSRQL